eukprot:jgi/Psemu1/7675/gm1.7675_g
MTRWRLDKDDEDYKYYINHDGVLEPCGPSDWDVPTFIVPKKNKQVQWVSDLWVLNKLIKRKAFPLPRI